MAKRRRGKSAAYLKQLRKKFNLGEYRKGRTIHRVQRLGKRAAAIRGARERYQKRTKASAYLGSSASWRKNVLQSIGMWDAE